MEQKKPVFGQVNIVAGSFNRSFDFYRRLGVSFPEPVTSQVGDPFHANGETSNGLRFELDSAAFARVWNPGWAAHLDLVGHVVLGFGVASREEVDRIYAELRSAGHPGLAPPHDAFWGARYAIIEDPNGIAVGLMSPIDPAARTWPPEGWPE
jgi:catechol 2,3-dioxygenase-like lactoylglutathione lyase family enzyme